MASGSADQTVRLWDFNTGEMVGRPLLGHTRVVEFVAFSPDSRFIAATSDDRIVRICDVKIGAPVAELMKGHGSLVMSVAFSPDGRRIASCSTDYTVRIWDGRLDGVDGGQTVEDIGSGALTAKNFAN